jgi:putative ABC transport system substrate-binding protein
MIFLYFGCKRNTNNNSNNIKKLLICQSIDHPALNNTRKGIVAALAEAGYVEGKNFAWRYESAQGNISLAQQIAAQFVAEKPDVVAAIATMPAQALAKNAQRGDFKLVFSSVTDPLGARLVDTLELPGGNISGVSNYVEIEPRMKIIKQILPHAKTIGTIYNPGDQNAEILAKKLESYCKDQGLLLQMRQATKATEVLDAASSLASVVDAIFINNDNMALAAFAAVIKGAQDKPVFVSDVDVVDLGALAALGPDQFEVGKQTGNMIARIFSGQTVGKQAVEFPARTEIYLNQKAALKSKVVFSKEVLEMATKVL